MGELHQTLRARLKVEDVIGARHGLQPEGAGFCTQAHDSLKVDPAQQLWTWFSRELNGKPAGGDVLAFLSFEKFGQTQAAHLTKEQQVDVLKEACALAGLDFEAEKQKSKGRHSQAKSAGAQAENADGTGSQGQGLPVAHVQGKRKKGRWFSTYGELEVAVSGWLERDGLALAKVWTYEALTKKGSMEPAIKVLRFEKMTPGARGQGLGVREKEIRPCHRVKNGWRLGLGPWGAKRWNAEKKVTETVKLCPLYGLAALARALYAQQAAAEAVRA